MNFPCQKCDGVFKTQRAVNAHQIAHIERESRYAMKRELFGLRKNPNASKTFDCLACGTENKWSSETYNKYCDNACQQDYYWSLRKEEIKNGEILGETIMRRYIIEKRGLVCEECHIEDEYNGKPITLQFDHIDGDSDNNALDNLRILCPNCHSQTETWCARNVKNSKRSRRSKRWREQINTYMGD